MVRVKKWWEHLVKEVKINPEKEEKPVVEAEEEKSEDYHGGTEITFSLRESENLAGEREWKRDINNKGCDRESEYGREKEKEGGDSKDQGRERNNRTKVSLRKILLQRKLMTAFQRFIERIAEVETKYELAHGYEKLSTRKLLKRALDRRRLSSCYSNRYKEKVILIIDTSGSMMWWEENLQRLVTLAVERDDIEIYLAPNGVISEKYGSERKIESDYIENIEFHERFLKSTKARVIVYVGDFDGGDTPYELSRNNQVYWICNEDRYEDTAEHDWCSHSLNEYPASCKILRAVSEEDLIEVLTKTKRR